MSENRKTFIAVEVDRSTEECCALCCFSFPTRHGIVCGVRSSVFPCLRSEREDKRTVHWIEVKE